MDLNVVLYENGVDNEKSISNKIHYMLRAGYKKIALSTQIREENISKIPVPIKVKVNSVEISVLNRLTIQVNQIATLYQLTKNENLKYYDILAIEPLNEKILNYLNSGNFDCDIITFNFEECHIINSIKKANFSLPISKGIGIEINYSNCLKSSSQRVQILACGQMLVDKTSSKNILLSSGAASIHDIRSPRDVIYIGLLFGLKENQSKKSVYRNGIGVIKHSELRKNIVSSVIEIIKLDDKNIYEELKLGNKRPLHNEDIEELKKIKT